MGCPALKYKVIFSLKEQYSIKSLCKILGVSRSGYYGWFRRVESQVVDKDKAVADLIKKCQKTNRFTYGYRRVVKASSGRTPRKGTGYHPLYELRFNCQVMMSLWKFSAVNINKEEGFLIMFHRIKKYPHFTSAI